MTADKTLLPEENFLLLRSALDKVAEYLPYLKADTTKSPGENFTSCSALLEDPKILKTVVTDSGTKIGAPSEQVAASLFLLSYSFRVLAMGIAPLLVSGLMPSSDPKNMYFDIASGRVSKLCYLSEKIHKSTGKEQDLQTAVDDIIENHLRLLTECLRSEFAIGSRLLWGNVASASASVFRTLEGLFGRDLIGDGELFFTLVPKEMQNQGNFYLLSVGDKHGWYWERKNCCLYYKLSKKEKCSDCSLLSVEQRREKYKKMLESS